jgi:group I intron endonuclease
MTSGIYKITSPSNKIYIGSSSNIELRWKYYKNLNCKKQNKLYSSFLKYGVSNHKFEILFECKFDELYEYEHLFSLLYNVLDRNKGLNCNIPGYNDVKKEVSEETKEKISLKTKGRKLSAEQILFLKNRKASEETKLKISTAGKLRKHSEETKLKQSLVKLGKKKTEEHKQNLSKAKTGLKLPESSKTNIGQKLKKLILNIETGIYYLGIKEAALSTHYPIYTIARHLQSKSNKTSFAYV